MTAKAPIAVETRDGIGWITLDRPGKRNAIDRELLTAVFAAIERLEADEATRVLIISGAGACFSAGIDLTWLAGGDPELGEPGKDEGRRLRRVIRWIQSILDRLEALEKPTIAMLHGFCGGLGLELALPCDFRVAAAGTRIGLPEVIFGIIPDCGGTTRLTRIAGIARAKQLIMTGEMISAEDAERFDIVHEVVAPEELRARCEALARTLIDRPPAALGLAKKLIDIGYGLDRQTNQQLEGLVQSVLMGSPNLGHHVMQGLQRMQGDKPGG